VLDLEAEAAVRSREGFHHLEARGDHFRADAIAADRRNLVDSHLHGSRISGMG
jgi:hypothetical protein